MGLTPEFLREMLDYNPETGVFLWRVNANSNGLDAKAGAVAGSLNKKGYRQIRIKGKAYYAHRLAWLCVYGEWPVSQIDHINMVKDDNRIANLRQASNRQNHMNRGKNKNNSSGFKGVSFDKARGKYAAYITAHGRRRFLGYFVTAEEAHQAYFGAAQKIAGKFARAA